MKIEFRHLFLNDKFKFDGKEYQKTNHQRGFYYEKDKKVIRYFKKNKELDRDYWFAFYTYIMENFK